MLLKNNVYKCIILYIIILILLIIVKYKTKTC